MLSQREGVKSANELSSVPETNGRQQVEKLNSSSSAASQYGYLKNYDSISHLSSRFRTEDNFADANAEKELVYFGPQNFFFLIFKNCLL